MVNGEIFYARYPISLDTRLSSPQTGVGITTGIFPQADFEIILSQTIPISGGSGTTNAVMLIVARAIT